MNAEDIYYDLSPEDAQERLVALAQQGDQAAEFYLGHLAEEKYPADFVEALSWYRKAAEGGYLDAVHWVASFMYHGMGTEQDLAGAMALFHSNAEAGHAASQWKLGQHLMQYPDRRAESIQWLSAASAQGHENAAELLRELIGAEAPE